MFPYGFRASLKRFAANSQERTRMVSDSVVDERTPREIHLAPFLCQRKTGAGNPAPVKRLNLYLSPIEA